jgi:hypothetical protein
MLPSASSQSNASCSSACTAQDRHGKLVLDVENKHMVGDSSVVQGRVSIVECQLLISLREKETRTARDDKQVQCPV